MNRNRSKIYTLILPIILAGLILIVNSCKEDSENGGETIILKPQLKACSFNIRFDNPADGLNQWDNRRRSVVNFLTIENPDIIGFQEVMVHQLEYMISRLPQYARVGVGREDGIAGGEFTPVFYKKERFELADSGTFWLSETPEVPSLGWDAQIKRICTWVYLEDKESGEQVHFYNTHFSHVGPVARTESIKLITDSIRVKSEGTRVILTGDFNAEPDSEPYSVVMADGFKDSFNSDIQLGPVGTWNGFSTIGPYNRRIDYILFKGFISEFYYCSSLLVNNNFLSDHFPVISLLEYRAVE